jgi:hypothetical protein
MTLTVPGLIVPTSLGFIGALLGPWVGRHLGPPEPFNREGQQSAVNCSLSARSCSR